MVARDVTESLGRIVRDIAFSGVVPAVLIPSPDENRRESGELLKLLRFVDTEDVRAKSADILGDIVGEVGECAQSEPKKECSIWGLPVKDVLGDGELGPGRIVGDAPLMVV